MNNQPDHVSNRNRLTRAIRRELMGPSCAGKPIDCTSDIILDDRDSFYGPNVQSGSRNEILKNESPRLRYGIGVLYPTVESSIIDEDPDEQGNSEDKEASAAGISTKCIKEIEEAIEKVASDKREKDSDDFDISLANLAKQQSMGVSFLADISEDGELSVSVRGGRYYAKDAHLKGNDKARTWWLRKSIRIGVTFKCKNILQRNGLITHDAIKSTIKSEGLDIRVELFSRPDPTCEDKQSGRRLLTVCIVNRTKEIAGDTVPLDSRCLFQSRFSVRIHSPGNTASILPYPEADITDKDEEERTLKLLYRKNPTFAIGHGCAADWQMVEGGSRVIRVSASPLPVYETPSITSEIRRKDNTEILVPMGPLAGLDDGDNGMSSVEEVVNLYGKWINARKKEIPGLEETHRIVATRHLELCRICYERMIDGLDYLKNNEKAARAFQWANYAILLQQLRSFRESRVMEWDSDQKRLYFKNPFISPDPGNPGKDRGKWRPFQIAFILMSLRSAAEDSAPEPRNNNIDSRETVELIWFPTGGGKTEAYLGLMAFSLFMRRLKDNNDAGTHAIMRYTLRLLTAQQFQRAAGLICAMEYIRRNNKELIGNNEFSIGIWLGRDTTPNTRIDAKKEYKDLKSGSYDTEYHFALLRCPWCGAQIGPAEVSIHPKVESKKGKKNYKKGDIRKLVLGLDQRNDTIILHCPDNSCTFHHHLPIYVTDEDIYEITPSLIIGTIDKFASLAWHPEARSIFGIDGDGKRVKSPPGLIIQDELHLITGPLGSMAGLYETIIEELCTDRRNPGKPIRPKIISSTATARRYKEQIKSLYARSSVILFPPPGLDASDSFFSSYARNDDGSLKRGRQYLGIHATNLNSLLTTQVRTYSAMLQAAENMKDHERDPWWTLLIFFNSLRELGGGLTLFQSDVPEKIFELSKKSGMRRRYLNNIKELTGRISSSDIPKALQELEKVPAKDDYPVDVCLASNIIEVGIDVDRLSLMCVVGQPKTTAQYIQVTGRVGRRWWERPGLIVTIYNPVKPRDRSHFEKFRTYHESLYAQVEPSTVTPFTPPALKRALHAVLVAYVRQLGGKNVAECPSPYPESIVKKIRDILVERVKFIDSQEKDNLQIELNKRIAEWKVWNHNKWQAGPASENPAQLRYAGMYYPEIWKHKSWVTPISMRSVDLECKPEITQLYLKDSLDEMGNLEEECS